MDEAKSVTADFQPDTHFRLYSKNISGAPDDNVTIDYRNASSPSNLQLRFRDRYSHSVVHSSAVSSSGVVSLPSRAGLYETELHDNGLARSSYGHASVSVPNTSYIPTQTFNPSSTYGHYRVWPDLSRAIGDYTGDGYLDFIYAAGMDGFGNSVGAGVYLYKYNPSTQQYAFDARLASDYPFIMGLQFLDAQGDGFLDIAFAYYSKSSYQAGICLMLNFGGIFGSPDCVEDTDGTADYQKQATDLAVADLDRDGILDLVLVGGVQNATYRITIYRGIGSGRFSRESELVTSTAQRYTQVRIADMNDDGRLDIVGIVGDSSDDATIHIYRQSATNSFSNSERVSHVVPKMGFFSTGYLNEDSKPDLVVIPQGNSTDGVYLQSNASDDTFLSSRITMPVEQVSGTPIVADLSNSGTPMVYFAPKNRLLYNNMSGIYFRSVASLSNAISLDASNTIVGASPMSGFAEANADLADLDNDGHIDLMYSRLSGAGRFEFIRGQ
ncbi:hypothetical protein BO221_49840 [Archangium sp. Cb G35]|uniref:FG-GAP repeat domain-containing protein n=1 Tax=Archangium sp. Cb G35 TaxID=1920190 RepID=UPI000935FCF0|nr:hypothetical protein BO221_49840 [Archangium sp. Cb G35]